MMNIFKKYLLLMFTTAIASALVFMLVVYQYEKRKLPGFAEFMQADNEVLFFGDSVLYSTGDCEQGDTNIDDWFRMLSGKSVLTLSHGAFSPIIYAGYTDLLLQTRAKFEYAVIAINLRSFSDEWFTNPQYNFLRETSILKLTAGEVNPEHLGNFMLYSATNYIDKLESSWLNQEVNYTSYKLGPRSKLLEVFKRTFAGLPDLECLDTIDEDVVATLSLLYQYHYGNELGINHDMFQYLKRTHENLLRAGITPVYYITPVNYKAAEMYAPNGLTQHIESNIKTITQWLEQRNARFLDLSFDLPDERFVEKHCACEHLDDIGRKYVASQLAEHINEI